MIYTGIFRPKEVPFSGFRYEKFRDFTRIIMMMIIIIIIILLLLLLIIIILVSMYLAYQLALGTLS